MREMETTRPVMHKDAALVPLLLNSPQIPPYDGQANPKAHIHLIMDAMIARGIKDAHVLPFSYNT